MIVSTEKAKEAEQAEIDLYLTDLIQGCNRVIKAITRNRTLLDNTTLLELEQFKKKLIKMISHP